MPQSKRIVVDADRKQQFDRLHKRLELSGDHPDHLTQSEVVEWLLENAPTVKLPKNDE